MEEVANELDVQRSLFEGHDIFNEENIVGFMINVNAMMEEFQAKT